jgi:AraC-like DNA-binding protein
VGIQLRNQTYYLTTNAGIQHYPELRLCREHLHDFIEFVYVLRGRCVHTIDGNQYIVKRGDMLVINYGQRHSIDGGSGEYINIFLKPEYIDKCLADQENAFALLDLAEFSDFRKILSEIKNFVTFTDFERSTVENVVMNLEVELKKMPAGYTLSVHSWFNLLLVLIFRKMALLQPEQFDGITEELLTYISTHCHERLEMTRIAAMCHYNSSYFSRAFKLFAGMSFTNFVKKERIKRAMQLLESTGMRVHDICHEVGYTDTTKFFKDFKECSGMTPHAYRKSMIP